MTITMTTMQALDMARNAMMLIIEISAPILVVGMVVGLIISLVQAVTQLQEQTISFVPKMVAMAVTAVIFLPWVTTKMMEFTFTMFSFK
jgi:flagellar biosynthesis protein FliQ